MNLQAMPFPKFEPAADPARASGACLQARGVGRVGLEIEGMAAMYLLTFHPP